MSLIGIKGIIIQTITYIYIFVGIGVVAAVVVVVKVVGSNLTKKLLKIQHLTEIIFSFKVSMYDLHLNSVLIQLMSFN
jgi:hypothetical protein